MNRNRDIPECSSPPCLLHEIDPGYAGLDIKPDTPPAGHGAKPERPRNAKAVSGKGKSKESRKA